MDTGVAIIDLGTDRYDPATDPEPPRPSSPRQRRMAALALAGALVLGTGGAAPPTPPQLEELPAVSLRVGSEFLLTPDRLFVTDSTPGTTRRVTAFEVGGERPLWTNTYRSEQRHFWMSTASGLLLLVDGDRRRGPIHTTALDVRTGRWRWSVPHRLDVLPDEGTALAVEEVYPPGSKVDPDNPPPDTPLLYTSRAGGVYSRPSIGAIARAVDLDTGRVLWTSPLLAAASPVPAAGGRPAVVLSGRRDGEVEVRDLRTGVVRQQLVWDGGVPLYPGLVGGVLPIWHDGGVSAYSADLSERRWHRPLPPETTVEACGPMLCLHSPGGLLVLDPVTGATAWRTVSRRALRSAGTHLVEITNADPYRTLDPATGRTLVDLADWADASEYEDDLPLLLLRRNGTAIRTWIGILDPGGTAVRPLEPVPYVLSSCQLVPGVFACRTQLGETRIWRYR